MRKQRATMREKLFNHRGPLTRQRMAFTRCIAKPYRNNALAFVTRTSEPLSIARASIRTPSE